MRNFLKTQGRINRGQTHKINSPNSEFSWLDGELVVTRTMMARVYLIIIKCFHENDPGRDHPK